MNCHSSTFADVKASVSMKQVAEHYGVRINRGGMAKCPFHDDSSPSMKIYKDSFYCFGCQQGGDLIKFVQLYDGCSPLEACKRLVNMFGLPIEIGKPRPLTFRQRYEQAKREKERKEKEKLEAWARDADLVLSACHRYLWDGLTNYNFEHIKHQRALRNLNVLEFDIDRLDRDPLEFYRDRGREVVRKYETDLDRWHTEDGGFLG